MTLSLQELYNTNLKTFANTPQIGIPWTSRGKTITKKSNPLCGDEIKIKIEPNLRIKNKFIIGHIFYVCKGCALCLSSAFVLQEIIKKCDEKYFYIVMDKLIKIMNPEENLKNLQFPIVKLIDNFAGVREFPQRNKCVLLPWETAAEAIKEEKKEWGF